MSDQIVEDRRRTLESIEDYVGMLPQHDHLKYLRTVREELSNPETTPDETVLLDAIRQMVEIGRETMAAMQRHDEKINEIEREIEELKKIFRERSDEVENESSGE